jgi:hypothetical protein
VFYASRLGGPLPSVPNSYQDALTQDVRRETEERTAGTLWDTWSRRKDALFLACSSRCSKTDKRMSTPLLVEFGTFY